MNESLDAIARAGRLVRLQQQLNQQTVAEESGVSLRSIQKIEAGSPVKSELLLRYLDFLGLLSPMLATLPDPDQPTPMELLQAAPKRQQRVRISKSAKSSENNNHQTKNHTGNSFKWGDDK